MIRRKILFASERCYWPLFNGGAEISAHEFLSFLYQNGWDVLSVSRYKPGASYLGLLSKSLSELNICPILKPHSIYYNVNGINVELTEMDLMEYLELRTRIWKPAVVFTQTDGADEVAKWSF